MAAEAFENTEIAQFLNHHFVAIKVDREQRPDIDQYMMAFLIQQKGHGGWPLNVILTPDQKPIIAMTYFPLNSLVLPGNSIEDCYKGICKRFKSQEELLNSC
jgi:uncharacterized protein YyaL (SSP411 family)